MQSTEFSGNNWALILGGSSGFGLATAKKLSAHGMSICVVHRDRRGAMDRIEKEFEVVRASCKASGAQFFNLNLDALSPEGQTETIAALQKKTQSTGSAPGKIRLLLHSIAFGNLKPIAPAPTNPPQEALSKLAQKLGVDVKQLSQSVEELFNEGNAPALATLVEAKFGTALIEEEDMSRTVYSMGTSFLSWVQKLHASALFSADARVLGLTSEGNEVAWRGYAAVAAAKVALESVSRSIAVEFAPFGIRSNIIQAGITDTPALRAIPGSAQMKAGALLRNPLHRLTLPEDVANVIYLLCKDEAAWINGTVIRVDGGEHIASA